MNNLNAYLQPLNAPVTQTKAVSGFKNEMLGEIQTNRLKAAFINISKLVVPSNVYVGTTVGFNSGLTARITMTLTHGTTYPDIMFNELLAIPLVSAYQGTAVDANYQLFPNRGGSITVGDYRTYGGGFDYTTSTKTKLVYMVNVENVSAGNQTILVKTEFKYIYNYGGGKSGI